MKRAATSKYRAVPTVVDGIRFASKAEARRFSELKLLEKAGEIAGLCLQPQYDLHVGGTKIGAYRADFEYSRKHRNPVRWEHVIEDVKGCWTDLARWKVKHVEAQYGIHVEIVK